MINSDKAVQVTHLSLPVRGFSRRDVFGEENPQKTNAQKVYLKGTIHCDHVIYLLHSSYILRVYITFYLSNVHCHTTAIHSAFLPFSSFPITDILSALFVPPFASSIHVVSSRPFFYLSTSARQPGRTLYSLASFP